MSSEGKRWNLEARRGEGLSFYIRGPLIHGEMQVVQDVDFRFALDRAKEAEARVERLRERLREFAWRVERDRREPDKLLTHVHRMRTTARHPEEGA